MSLCRPSAFPPWRKYSFSMIGSTVSFRMHVCLYVCEAGCAFFLLIAVSRSVRFPWLVVLFRFVCMFVCTYVRRVVWVLRDCCLLHCYRWLVCMYELMYVKRVFSINSSVAFLALISLSRAVSRRTCLIAVCRLIYKYVGICVCTYIGYLFYGCVSFPLMIAEYRLVFM